MAAKGTAWWENIFDDLRPLFDMKSADTMNQVRFIIKKLDLKPGSKFLDCPCGIGRISLPLAQRGIRVTGVDITVSYLEEFKKTAERRKLKVDLHHLDMRKINFKNQFEAAGNLWTSFGYFEKESDDFLVIRKIYQALKPGGRFMLHLINRDWIITNFSPNDWSRVGKIKILEERSFDYRTSRSKGIWHFIKDSGESSYEVTIRVYSYHELVRMLEKAGFADIEGYGTTKEEPISRDHRMMFIIGTKPKKR
ncbi:MAG: methyltransferase domain-containing protein [candidate division Zixibacteria bacterium]|nr:methyltransferase domain-containing protein [candidate division Zixibacteria bacterium]